MWWLLFAGIAAISAGLTSITMKVGLKDADSDVATLFRTGVVLIFALIMVFVVGGFADISNIAWSEWLFILGSGVATGLSWITFYKALKLGNANKVVPIDRLSTVLTMSLAIIIFSESFWWLTFVSMGIMLLGTMLMVVNREKKVAITTSECIVVTTSKEGEITTENQPENQPKNTPQNTSKKFKYMWAVYAVLSLIFASAATLLVRAGITPYVSIELVTFFRTIIVLAMAFIIVLGKKKLPEIKKLTKKSYIFLLVSGILTGISWLAFFSAIQIGYVSQVVPIDKLSIVITIIFATLYLKEKLTPKALIGFVMLVTGTLLLLV